MDLSLYILIKVLLIEQYELKSVPDATARYDPKMGIREQFSHSMHISWDSQVANGIAADRSIQ